MEVNGWLQASSAWTPGKHSPWQPEPLWTWWRRQNVFPHQESNHGRSTCNLVTVPTELFLSFLYFYFVLLPCKCFFSPVLSRLLTFFSYVTKVPWLVSRCGPLLMITFSAFIQTLTSDVLQCLPIKHHRNRVLSSSYLETVTFRNVV